MRRAFTLIELLVVIAIIAILAAILFPVYGLPLFVSAILKAIIAISIVATVQSATRIIEPGPCKTLKMLKKKTRD